MREMEREQARFVTGIQRVMKRSSAASAAAIAA